ncbi:hypothetical protein BDY21DRAFT_355231 [Lineolata rhizophorae]|uniref:SIS domain-containing protein n=1 Tax=Lineolata rhizophorae TaxID=578093 RepID=A0A6A6NQN7_9PEZI|nr:hypothetical protein BDY21DRAFT_355231 [Lineolata rhizophorae]
MDPSSKKRALSPEGDAAPPTALPPRPSTTSLPPSPHDTKRLRTETTARITASTSPSTLLLTPPSLPTDAGDDTPPDPSTRTALRVLVAEAAALAAVSRLYATSPGARSALARAVEAVAATQGRVDGGCGGRGGGRLVVCGVGKSGLVGRKTAATMRSLGVGCGFVHAGEAAHGDLGDVRENDVLLFISFSGRTPELLSLIPHLPASVPVLALTAHTEPSACPLLVAATAAAPARTTILLPAPILEPEEVAFGVAAPTCSTTVAMAVGDALALAVAERVYEGKEGAVAEAFRRNHPGGAIGSVSGGGGR